MRSCGTTTPVELLRTVVLVLLCREVRRRPLTRCNLQATIGACACVAVGGHRSPSGVFVCVCVFGCVCVCVCLFVVCLYFTVCIVCLVCLVCALHSARARSSYECPHPRIAAADTIRCAGKLFLFAFRFSLFAFPFSECELQSLMLASRRPRPKSAVY